MSIGANILIHTGSGDAFESLSADLDGVVTEIRIEQHLDQRSTFAIRLQEDFEDGEAVTITADELRGAKGVAIAVPSGGGQPPQNGLGPAPNEPEELVCLIRGQIENAQASVTIAGSGSWYEVRGRDVRTIIDRKVGAWEYVGTTGEVASAIIGEFTVAEIALGEDVATFSVEQPYRFVGTMLEALERLATLCNYPVWLEYPIKRTGATVNGVGFGPFTVDILPHFEPSPPRGQDLPPGVELDLAGVGGHAAYLRIMGTDKVSENVVNFSLNHDSEAISYVTSSVVDPETGKPVTVEGQQSTQDPVTPDGEDVKNVGVQDSDRSMVINKVGNPDIAASAARAAANDASWYVKANALTTVHMLGVVLKPHDLVEVIGGGCGIGGVFQVEKVTHVINAAAHWMHLDLRSNSRSLRPAKEGLIDA